jgi:hypothetical protein
MKMFKIFLKNLQKYVNLILGKDSKIKKFLKY